MKNIQEEMRINTKQIVQTNDETAMEVLKEIVIQNKEQAYQSEGDTCWILLQAYTYGIIQGKRMERARRKKTAG